MKALATFTIPMTYGDFALFPDFKGKIRPDKLFLEFMNEGTTKFEIRKPFSCEIREHEDGGKFADLIGPRPLLLTKDKVLAILSYLGRDGWHYLYIPEGQNEVNVLIGYIEIAGHSYILYVEHENEDGKTEEIHIHLATSNKSENDIVRVIKVVEEDKDALIGWTHENLPGQIY